MSGAVDPFAPGQTEAIAGQEQRARTMRPDAPLGRRARQASGRFLQRRLGAGGEVFNATPLHMYSELLVGSPIRLASLLES
jgi:hypothetical protein